MATKNTKSVKEREPLKASVLEGPRHVEDQCMFKPCARQCLKGPDTQTLQLDCAHASSAQLVPN